MDHFLKAGESRSPADAGEVDVVTPAVFNVQRDIQKDVPSPPDALVPT